DVRLNPGYQFDQGDNKWTLGIMFELPVLNQNQGPIAEAGARREEAAARLTALQTKVIGEIDQAVAGYRSARGQLATATALLTACSRSEEDKDSGKSNSKESRVKRGANGEIIVTLDDPTQKRIGLILDNPAPAQWQTEVRGYGRVLDPGPLAALVAELDAGRAAAEASRQEYERLKVLVEQTNASLRALQAADAAAKRDRLFVESTRAKLALSWGKAITERNDLSA